MQGGGGLKGDKTEYRKWRDGSDKSSDKESDEKLTRNTDDKKARDKGETNGYEGKVMKKIKGTTINILNAKGNEKKNSGTHYPENL